MFDRLSLRMEFIGILLVLLLVSVVNTVIIFSVVNQQSANGRAINLAGRQRMLTQKMSKEIFIYHSAAESERQKVKSDVKKTAQLFDTTLSGLLNGDTKQELSAVDNPEIEKKLLEVQALWKDFYNSVNIAINSEYGSDQSLAAMEVVKKTNVPLLKTMNQAVGLYEKNNNVQRIKIIQGILLAIAFLVTVTASYLTLTKLVGPMHAIVEMLKQNAENMNGLSATVASSAESIADGTSSQAAATEETAASLEEITSMTRQNAENTNSADDKMRTTKETAERAYTVMEEMNTSMGEILTASEETQKIVKTIDEIAFQTNLLSLNAAVEAARAGEAGAGFAVVADEVRNLALRSAESAKDTAQLIDNIVQKIEGGSSLVKKATESFSEVSEGAGMVANLLAEITTANNEQTLGISQISTGINEMDRLTQEAAASTEEMAATAKEMDSDSTQLNGVVAKLVKLLDGEGAVSQVDTQISVRPASVSPAPKKAATQLPKQQLAAPQVNKASEKANSKKPEDIIPMDDEMDTFEDF